MTEVNVKKIEFPYELKPELRDTAKKYLKIKLFNSLINTTLLPIVVLVLLLFTGLNIYLGELPSIFGLTGIYAVPVYAVFFTILLSTIQLPLSFYSGFVLEHKFGLSNHSVKSWFTDYFKGLLLGIIFTVVTVVGLYLLIGLGDIWWLYVAGFFIAFDLFVNFIYPIAIFPFFYKTVVYKDIEMKNKLLDMVKKAGVTNVNEVLVGIESEKSKKANAMFAGFGKTKRIVLFDTLLDNFTQDEIETVVGHELGHYVHKDIWKGIIFEAIETLVLLYIIKVVMDSVIGMYGIIALDNLAGFPVIYLLMIIVGFLLSPIFLYFSRKMEGQADYFALEYSRKPIAQISTEKRLTDMNLSDFKPPLWIEYMFFSHPATWRRVKMAEEWMAKNGAEN